ncbi:alpha/beta fold hydrolase [Duganella sp. FT109W]|uniref:Alpha/beta fold hydrolase n=1 Tax=Duganella margarita TaxID=2692170 RepID=A0ABW9WCP5_9BURK|nr:alpha/beta fold hydrolase [Duganella margarita]MYN38724.1 alpha/beta fold hydrolase [Duganella margarita]
MQSQRQEFIGAHGHKLAARLDGPDGAVKAYALFAHCFTCGKDVFAASRVAQALTEHGIAVLRFDFTGLGASEGEFANTNFSSNLADLVAAADFMRQTYQAPQLLIGHSLGGAAVLASADQMPEVKAVVTIAAPSDPVSVTGLFSQHLDEIARDGEALVQLAGRPFRIQQQFVEDAGGHNLKLKIAALRRALLVMHAPGDDTVGLSNAMEIFTAARHPKSFISLDSADHLLTRRDDAVYVANVIAVWADRYLF